jgi:2OG-Fe(II) oxygenase superfamily/Oxoglutarate and iron-dependent oxygenase degradation C-term
MERRRARGASGEGEEREGKRERTDGEGEAGVRRRAVGKGGAGEGVASGGGAGCEARLAAVLQEEEAVAELHRSFREARPFAHAHVEGFLEDDGLLEEVLRELEGPETAWVSRRNDLLELEQTNAPMTAPDASALGRLRALVYSAGFRAWIGRVTGVAVSATVDLSAARYGAHAFLSCHDDDLSERRVAFVLYLNRDWDAARDGGGLELFDAEGGGEAGAVVRRLNPAWNSLALFEVSPISFHQVNEVLREPEPEPSGRKGKKKVAAGGSKGGRVSISGWFHGEPIPRPPPAEQPTTSVAAVLGPAGTQWLEGVVSAQYLDEDVIQDMEAHFASNASLDLAGFLEPDVERRARMGAGRQQWEHVGPATLRNYHVSRSCRGGPVWDARAQTLAPLATARWLFPDPSSSLAPLSEGEGAEEEGGDGGGGGGGKEGEGSAREVWNGTEPDMACRLRSLVVSRPFAEWLAKVTGLDPSILSRAASELRCFSDGAYSMICDPDAVHKRRKHKRDALFGGSTHAASSASSSAAADDDEGEDEGEEEEEEEEETDGEGAFLCGVLGLQREEEWEEEAGGYTVVTTNDEELMRIPPRANHLSLFMRGKGVFSFVRRITAKAPENLYQIYFEFAL